MRIDQHRWVLRMTLWSLPLPWIATRAGWFMTSLAVSPRAIQDIPCRPALPPGVDAGPVGLLNVVYPRLYTLFLIAEVYLDAEVRASWAERQQHQQAIK